jgi:hypothetical protein
MCRVCLISVQLMLSALDKIRVFGPIEAPYYWNSSSGIQTARLGSQRLQKVGDGQATAGPSAWAAEHCDLDPEGCLAAWASKAVGAGVGRLSSPPLFVPPAPSALYALFRFLNFPFPCPAPSSHFTPCSMCPCRAWRAEADDPVPSEWPRAEQW